MNGSGANASCLSTDANSASNVIVINPGSLYLKIGRASDSVPLIVPQVIARRNKSKNNAFPCLEDPFLVSAVKLDKETNKQLCDVQHSVLNVLSSCLTSSGYSRNSTSKEKLSEFNKKVKPVVLPKSSQTIRCWTCVENKPDVLIGEDALYLKPSEPYHVRWPIRRGQLNVHSGIGGSINSIISDLERIWAYFIETKLNINLKTLSNFKAVLTIPDVYNRNHVKELISMVLNGLGFGSCFIHHEAVFATFGAGLSSATVIDVGDQKTSVCCVEDGFSPRCTRITLEYGGSDITQVFHYLLKQRNFPYTECKSESRVGGLLLQELKENFCHLDINVCGVRERQFQVKIPEQPVLQYNILLGDECLVAPLALFHPELFAVTGNNKKIRTLSRNEGDSEDPFDENYLIQTKRKYGETTEASGGNENLNNPNDQLCDEDLETCEVPVSGPDKEIKCDQLLGIDQAVMQCIDRCDNDDTKRRMYNCVLVVGGGINFKGIDTWLQSRLSVQIPLQYRTGQCVDIITNPKDIDPRCVVWKGAAVMSLLDTTQELWITKNEWENVGVRIVREKAPFVW
ncbi:actin-related protein 8-like protein [Dinothrombium tinctorium]|uniref:Actin-related protein 8 n=1 Tax=Dinothrombium tinctorium TaxID=1965070 RepID=A0A3S4RKX6_9ACAR|nr:actin-related protein 8-like protein [Dinothrombium tinctorium]RWS17459.1 actin-related protein 8-like protein [Dinothrombium tinctorium]